MPSPTNNHPAQLGTPAAEWEITDALVQRLLREQQPDLADLPIVLMDAGWDNAMYRLGEAHIVRLPRRIAAATLVQHEQRWLPVLASRLPLSVPVPYRVGVPTNDYPWHWSIVPHLSGDAADLSPPNNAQAVVLAAFLKALHQPAPQEAPTNAVRGVPLRRRADAMELRLHRLETTSDAVTPSLIDFWQATLDVLIDVPPCWLHGDLHPRNVLVENGALTAIIDWGDITAGDVATDLAAIWMLFSELSARERALLQYGVSEATRQRAMGWAILFGVMLLDSGRIDNPRHAAIGRRTLQHVAEDIAGLSRET